MFYLQNTGHMNWTQVVIVTHMYLENMRLRGSFIKIQICVTFWKEINSTNYNTSNAIESSNENSSELKKGTTFFISYRPIKLHIPPSFDLQWSLVISWPFIQTHKIPLWLHVFQKIKIQPISILCTDHTAQDTSNLDVLYRGPVIHWCCKLSLVHLRCYFIHCAAFDIQRTCNTAEHELYFCLCNTSFS